MAAGTDFDRLADYVTSRRVDLGIDQAELADRMGMHRRTISRIETGSSVKRDTYATLEKELGWTPGSARRVLEGGTPTVRSGPQSAAEQAVAQLSSLDGVELLEAARRWHMRLGKTEFDQAVAAAVELRGATVQSTQSEKAT